jgi:hypothetical protein
MGRVPRDREALLKPDETDAQIRFIPVTRFKGHLKKSIQKVYYSF